MAFFASLLPQFGFRTEVFFFGEFCAHNQFAGEDPIGHLHLINKGHVVMEHDNAPSLDIRVPSLVIYPRPYRHRLVVRAAPAELICANIAFRNAQRNPLANLLPSYMAIPLDELKEMASTLSLLTAEAAGQEEGKQDVMDRLCDILIIQLFRHVQRSGDLPEGIMNRLTDGRIAGVITAIQAAPAKPWSIEEMARVASMSRSSFAKHFNDTMGMPPATYLTEMRLTLATSYLKQKRSVKETAMAVGYSSQPAFTKAFSAKFGMAPLKWLAHQS